MSVTIYTMTHKKFDPPEDPIYVPLHVGRATASDLGYIGDHTGEQISSQNDLFGELTGLYWAWKNDTKSDIKGLCHYRRYLGNEKHELLSKEEYEALLDEYDMLTSEWGGSKGTIRERYEEAHHKKDLDEVERSIAKLYPEYLADFQAVMKESKQCFANLMAAKKDVFDTYCEWLFAVLFDAQKRIDVSGYDNYQRRVFGFLSERLHMVYIRHHHLRVKGCYTVVNDEKAETKELKLAVRQLLLMGQVQEAYTLFQKVIAVRPDVTLQMSDVRQQLPMIDHILYILLTEQEYGYQGFGSQSMDLTFLLEQYKKVLTIFCTEEEPRQEDISFLQSIPLTPIAAAVIMQGDISAKLRLPPIQQKQCKQMLQQVMTKQDYQTYCNIME